VNNKFYSKKEGIVTYPEDKDMGDEKEHAEVKGCFL